MLVSRTQRLLRAASALFCLLSLGFVFLLTACGTTNHAVVISNSGSTHLLAPQVKVRSGYRGPRCNTTILNVGQIFQNSFSNPSGPGNYYYRVIPMATQPSG